MEEEPQEFKDVRRALFEQLEAIASADDHLAFQARLAGEILNAEKLNPLSKANKQRRIIFKDHMRMLRSYGDALAWTLLHSHTIRNLAKNDGRPPWLTSMEPALVGALDFVRELAGHPD